MDALHVTVEFDPRPLDEVADAASCVMGHLGRVEGEAYLLDREWEQTLCRAVEQLVDQTDVDFAGWVLLQMYDLCRSNVMLTLEDSRRLGPACVRHLQTLGATVKLDDPDARTRRARKDVLGNRDRLQAPPSFAGPGNLIAIRSSGGTSGRR